MRGNSASFTVPVGRVAGTGKDVRVRAKEKPTRSDLRDESWKVPGAILRPSVLPKMGAFAAVRKTGQHR